MSELGVKRLTIGVRDGARRVDTPVRVQVTEGPGAVGDPRSASAAVDWLADGRLDVSRALAQARFATGLDASIPPAPPAPPPPPPKINVRWVDGLIQSAAAGWKRASGLTRGTRVSHRRGAMRWPMRRVRISPPSCGIPTSQTRTISTVHR